MSGKQQEKESKPSGNHRRSNSASNKTDDATRKKTTSAPSRHYNGGNAKNKVGGAGGWDSAHQHRHRTAKEPPSDSGSHNGIRRSKSHDGHAQPRDGHPRTSQNRAHPHRHHAPKGAGHKPHPPSNSLSSSLPSSNSQIDKAEEPNASVTLDSGIGHSSPENGLNLDDSMTEKVNDEELVSKEEEGIVIEEQGEEETIPCCNEEKSNRLIYSRDELLALKDCTRSLMTPQGFDCIEQEIMKEILKRHSSTSSGEPMWDDVSDIIETDDSSRLKHPTTLNIIKEHNKVSLTPQRRSFGSGCSWRDNAGRTTSISESEDKDEVFHSQPRGHSTSGTPTGHRVIDHIPYRNRGGQSGLGEWVEGKRKPLSSWRGDNRDVTFKDDDEPEWMSYGPTDRSELMELKGLEEHEQARVSNYETKGDVDNKLVEGDNATHPKQSPPSGTPPSCENSKDDTGSSSSFLASSTSPRDDQEFILEGLDFSSGLSICHALASDSDDDEITTVKSSGSSLPHVSDKHELTNALMNILHVQGEGENPMERYGGKTPLRAVTLDEIEEPRPQRHDQDQTAFNKLLAAIKSPRDEHDVSQQPNLGNNKGHSSCLLFPGNNNPYKQEQLLVNSKLPMRSPTYPHQWPPSSGGSGHWMGGGGGGSVYRHQLLNPSPSSLGMQPHHIRQQQLNTSWVNEMEQRRIMEQMAMLQQEKERQKYQQQQIQRSSSSPSISFLPTSVIRQMHSKPMDNTHHQTLNETSRQHNSPSQIEQEYSANLLRMSSQGEGPMVHPSHHFHHHPSLLPPHIRSHHYPSSSPAAAVGGGMAFRSSGPGNNHMGGIQYDPIGGSNYPVMNQQYKLGIPTAKPGLF